MDWLTKWQIGSTVAIGVAAVVYILLERRFPYTKGQKLFREGFFNDFVLYTLVQSYVLGLVIAWLITIPAAGIVAAAVYGITRLFA